MMADGNVIINGVIVDINDPCAVAAELKKVELIVVTGGGVARSRFGLDEVQWNAANLGRLRELIQRYECACAAKSGKRLRYAKRMRFVR
ncbi:hypothetical protein FJ872_19460 [Mesorhizobium sp. B2-5-9]|uniref:hypothetical protein n=1 Tax=Mesorhizobium sp. B2-5-9 TaxID=2589921 RepID=UPI001172920E|nr:hypothetical protein [Mesorhizobium sp. B2-5-9]TPK15178.1 hypothetical protein FJ872_19460 [Mesorhizobium sp. B2-5-9]